MNRTIREKIKNIILFLLGSCLVIFGYIRRADNIRSENRQYGNREKEQSDTPPIRLEPDMPEISSGTQ